MNMNGNKIGFCLFLFLITDIGAINPNISGSDLEITRDLYSTILATYETRIRPRVDQSRTLQIDALFTPNNIIEFDTSEQKFSILGVFKFVWWDEMLQWDPANYDGTDTMKIPIKHMWTPNMVLEKAYDGNGVIGEWASDVIKVTNDGEATWIPEGIYSVVCEVNIQYYPFDEQECVLAFYVTGETLTTVELTHASQVDLEKFLPNAAWDLLGTDRIITQKHDNNHVEIRFTMQRRSSFTIFTLVFPLLMLAFLNIATFLVPIGTGEKGSFAVTIFLSYGIFVTIVSDTLPHNSLQMSYFILFITSLLSLSVVSVFYVVMQAKLVSVFGQKECNARLCCIRKPRQTQQEKIPCSEDDADVAADEAEKQPTYTWNTFFEKLDNYLFMIFGVLIITSTIIFFGLMMRRVNRNLA